MNKGGYGMKQFIFLLVVIITFCTTVYGQVEEGVSQSQAFHFDQDQLLNHLAALEPFKPEKGGEQEGSSFLVTQEDFRSSLVLLTKEQAKVDEIMINFRNAFAFSFKSGTKFLTLTQWIDHEAAKNFMNLRYELWRLMDEKDPSLVKDVQYQEIDLIKDEKALLTRKTLGQDEQKYPTISFLSSRKNYVFECNFIGNYNDQEVKKIILQIWKIVESEEKKGKR
jgi:hypothetical protein